MIPDRLETLRNFSVEDIQVFLKTRKSEVIPIDMQDYITKMDRCSVIINTQGANMTLATEELRRCFPDLSYTQARRIYYDALEYFHVDEPESSRSPRSASRNPMSSERPEGRSRTSNGSLRPSSSTSP